MINQKQDKETTYMLANHRIKKTRTKKRVCGICWDKPAVFHVRNRRTGAIVVKADKNHNFCPKCWNSMLDSSQSKRSYKKNVLLFKGYKAELNTRLSMQKAA